MSHPIRYIYARARTNLAYADSALSVLREKLPDRTALLTLNPNSHGSWRNGFVLKCETSAPPHELADELREGLDALDGWAIFGSTVGCEEMGGMGVVSYFAGVGWSRVAQMFVTFDENDSDPDRTCEKIMASLNRYARPVFYFDGGRALMVFTDEPSDSIFRRCRGLLNRLNCWAITDGLHGTTASASSDAEKVWVAIEPTMHLFFEPTEDI